MKLKYPAEAFALGIILFSAGMKEAFAAGILVILSVVFAEFLKGLLEKVLPKWSLALCVCIATGALSSSALLLGFAALGSALDNGTWLLTFFIGLLSAKTALLDEIQGDYNELLWESALAWGFWILLAAVREFMGTGCIFGNLIYTASFQSKSFLDDTFSFLTAGMALAFTNGVLKKSCVGLNSLLVVIPAAIFVRPFTMDSFGQVIGIVWTILVPVILFLSVKKTLEFCRAGKAYRGLPVDLLSAGFIYMILSIY